MPPKKPQKTKAVKSSEVDGDLPAKPSKKVKTSQAPPEKGSIDFDSLPKVKVPNVKSFKEFDPGQPSFPNEYEVVKNCLLQVTDIKDNHNKFYSLELHLAKGGKTRLFTHYGRTDDLQRGGGAGQKEVRYYDDLATAYAAYNDIYKKKTAAGKGYKPLNLVRMNSNIGSEKVKGKSAGAIDDKTKQKIEESKRPEGDKKKKIAKKTLNLDPLIEKLISHLYEEATKFLTASVSIQFTEEGIKTPLGVLTIEQIEKGEDCLSRMLEEIKKKNPNKGKLEELSSEFFTMIPHHLGRSKDALKSNVITTEKQYTDKMELMQLMKDMVKVAGSKEGNVLIDPNVEAKYKALGCEITVLDNKEQKEIQDYINKNLTHNKGWGSNPKIKHIYEISRADERKEFNKKIGNEKLMFHGSRMPNWVGILTRGILLPQAVTKLGVHRTDFGWLGAGIYFGDVWQTSAGYTGQAANGTCYMLIVNVGLGKIFDQKNIDGSIQSPPKGFDSIHGNPDLHGGFSDHEYCIYKQNQQFMKYLVEFQH